MREKIGKNWNNIQMTLLSLGCVIALLFVLFPLLLIAPCDYPSADDWSFGASGYAILKAGGGLGSFLKNTVASVSHSYQNWEGRFAATFLASFQPGILGEKCYCIVPWLMLGAIIVSEVVLCRYCSRRSGGEAHKYYLPIILPAIIFQILYSPSPIESFYWYTGAVNYTFVYGLSLLLLVLFLRMGGEACAGWRYALTAAGACVLAVLVGGNNFATSLSTFLALCTVSVIWLKYHRSAFFRTWYVTLGMGICLLACIFAPGNANRLKGNFGGTTGNAVEAIGMSLLRSATNILSWTDGKILLMLLFVLPFLWMSVRKSRFSFPLPALFTLITFGLYASQAAATMYVDGTTGGGRMAAILYYSYVIWLVGNMGYWIGWLSHRKNRFCGFLDRLGKRFGRYLIVYCGGVGLVLVAAIYLTDLRQISSYRAYRDWRQGWAGQYAVEWDARLEILHDDRVKEVEFAPLSVYPEMLLYTDLQEESGYYWVNEACAQYYGKEYVHIVPTEE